MNNKHIVIDPGLRCLCGNYGGEPVGCAAIIDALNNIEDDFADGHHDSCLLINKVLKTYEVDCE